MKGIVDRIEGDYFVIEIDGITNDVPAAIVARGVKAGDAVELRGGMWKAAPAETKAREQRIRKLMEEVWSDD